MTNDSQDEARKFWNEAYKDDPSGGHVRDHLLLPAIRGLRPGRALDLGCGAGENAFKLSRLGWSVIGVDFAAEAIRIANEAARRQSLDAHFVEGDSAMWKEEAPFDLVVSTFALPGGTATTEVIRNAASALGSGGTLIIADWERAMADVWHFRPEELATVEQVTQALPPTLDIQTAETRVIYDMFPDPNDMRHTPDGSASVVFVRAVNPR